MKNVLAIVAFVLLTSFVGIEKPRMLTNGHYLVQLDKEYKERGLNDFDFTLENEKFTTYLAGKYETLEIIWVDDHSFIVKGLTEPANPTEMEKAILKNEKIYFRITKQEHNTSFFTLVQDFDNYPIYAGKFVKTE